MNQILYTGTKNKGPASIKSILRFFSFSLIILGIVFIGKSSYSIYQSYELSKANDINDVPQIVFEQEVNNAIVKVSNNTGISKIKYHWNDDTDTIIQANNEKTVILDNITISPGTNTLYVSAIDSNGQSSQLSNDYSYDGISIEFSVVDNTYLKIMVTDVKGLSYLSYKWNSEESVLAYPDDDDNTKIEQLIEIPSGLNTIEILAVDLDNKTLTKTQDIKGNHPPVIKLYIQDTDLIVMISDEEGIDKIIQKIENQKDNTIKEEVITVDGVKEYNYKYGIADDEQVIVRITAIDVEGVGRTYNGKNY